MRWAEQIWRPRALSATIQPWRIGTHPSCSHRRDSVRFMFPSETNFPEKKVRYFEHYFQHILKILQRLKVFWKYVALDAQRNIEAGVWCEPSNCAGLRPKLVGRDSTRGSLWHAFGLVWSLTDWCWWCWPCLWHVSRALCSNICRWFFVSCFSYVFPTTFSMCFGLLCLFQFRGCLTVTLTAPTAPPTTFPLHSTSSPRPSSQWRNLEWITTFFYK